MTASRAKKDASPQQRAAVDWLLRLERDGDAAQPAFQAWLGDDPRHRAAWAQVSGAWQRIGAQPPVHAALWAAPPAAGPAAPGRSVMRRRWVAAGIGAALAACLLLLLLPGVLLRLQADRTTGTGEVAELVLPDGSLLRLAPESAVRLDFGDGRREVDLMRGQAFFEVRPDPARPFTAGAGAVGVHVLGTAFDLRRSAGRVVVEVREGHVRVDRDGGGTLLAADLQRGERLVVAAADGPAQRQKVDPDSVALWRDGRLFLDGIAIGDAVDRLRPYLPGITIVADSGLARQKVTGLFDLTRPEAALAALLAPYGGAVQGLGSVVRVISAGDPASAGARPAAPGK